MAEKKKVITNQAEIDAANRANTAAAQRKAQLEKVVTDTRALNQPIFNQALGGARNVTSAFNTFLAATQNPQGIYDPISGKVTKTAAQLKQEADTARAAISGSNRLGGLTTEQIDLSKGYNQTIQDALNQAENITFGNVPSPIYSEEETDTAGKTSAYDLLNEFKLLGLDSLLEDVKRLIIDGVGDDQLLLEIRKTPAWQKRFAANKTRLAKGLRALSEGEYIDLETKYQDVMRNYGLPASYYSKTATGTNESFEELIGGNVSPVKLEERIMIGTNRVLNKSPFITTALKQFYPNINNSNILAYTLDPEKGLEDIRKKVTAAEIGGAALGAGLTTSLTDAEYLRRYGVTKETAQRGYEIIGGGLERGRQLADIYQQPDYTQAVAEEEVFNLPGQTESQQKRKKIIGLEKAEFGGQTGMTSGALSRDRAGSY
jgi:hypothetical protein